MHSIMKIYLVLLVSVLVNCNAIKQCPKNCNCENTNDKDGLDYVTLSCLHLDLSTVPISKTWPEGTEIADFQGNKIKMIEEDTFYGAREENLVILRLANNKMSMIEGSAFTKLAELEQLYLNKNRLSALHPETFKGLDGLKVLDISYNDIRVLPTDIFSVFTMLSDLTIGNNPLKVIQPEVLAPLISLEMLSSEEIGCKTLEDNVFHPLIDLGKVDLSGNKFENVPAHEMATTDGKNGYGITYLTMNKNPISILDSKSFKGLDNLASISFCNMPNLKAINKNTFSNLKKLVTVRLSNNPMLTSINPDAFGGLFTNNHADSIPLLEVHLNGNGLSKIAPETLPWSKLQTIDLQQNSWSCDCHMKWFRKIKTIILDERMRSELRCSSPKALANERVDRLKSEDFICVKQASIVQDHGNTSVILIWCFVTIFVTVISVVIIIYVVRKRSGYKYRSGQKHGIIRYRKAHTQPEHMDPTDV